MGLDIEDADALVDYLRSAGRIAPGERPACTTLAGGVSNRTVRVARASGEAWVIKQALRRLRVAVEWYSDPERVHREALGMRWLALLAPPGSIPEFLFEDPEHHLVAMRAVPEPHVNWKSLLLAGRVERGHVEQFGRLLGTIHRNGSLQVDRLPDDFRDQGYFQSLRVEPYFRYAASRTPAAAPFLDGVISEMDGVRVTLVHGDYSPKNVLVAGGRLVLLDHEVIHLGDPAFDVGFSLTHLLSKANHLPEARDTFANAALRYWTAYLEAVDGLPWAAELPPRAVRQTLACLVARVAGRSPLEYLDPAARERQLSAACALLARPPARVEELVPAFIERL